MPLKTKGLPRHTMCKLSQHVWQPVIRQGLFQKNASKKRGLAWAAMRAALHLRSVKLFDACSCKRPHPLSPVERG